MLRLEPDARPCGQRRRQGKGHDRSALLGDRLGIALMRGQRAAHLDAAAGGDMLPGVTLIIDGRRAGAARARPGGAVKSEEHTSELQSLMRISYAVFCLKKKTTGSSIRYSELKQQEHKVQVKQHITNK